MKLLDFGGNPEHVKLVQGWGSVRVTIRWAKLYSVTIATVD